MNDALKEQVSALMDDELRRQEKAMLLRRLSQDPELAPQLGRYGLIGEAMRRNLPPVVDADLASRVAAAIDAEPAHAARAGGVRQSLLRPFAGIAVAATVAAVSIAIWPGTQPTEPRGAEFVAGAPGAESPAVRSVAAETEYGHWDRLEPQIQQRLNDYLANHSEHTATGRFGGMLNYVRITGHQHDD